MSARSKNPFGDEDEDSYKFGNRTTSNFNPNSNNNNNNNSNFRKPASSYGQNNDDDNLGQIQQKIGKVENDSLESTQRALRMLNETHEIGVGAARVSIQKLYG